MHRISGRIPTEIIGFSGGLIFLFTTNKRIRYTRFVMFIDLLRNELAYSMYNLMEA